MQIIDLGALYKSLDLRRHHGIADYGGTTLFNSARCSIFMAPRDATIVLDFTGAYGYLERSLKCFATELAHHFDTDLIRRTYVVCEDEPPMCERFFNHWLNNLHTHGKLTRDQYTIRRKTAGSYTAMYYVHRSLWKTIVSYLKGGF